ncbi:putative arm-like repeat-containing protein [Rosellinia necatrix]|uniref:Putative arm-like repeat-containing protein n=1 Tax=Rosellinia necatrix TaxID=77044 RepID=A0A1W2TEC2_ROSNE|nr:putative arm-like repeat-containing protein [Rosellinia necatrix]
MGKSRRNRANGGQRPSPTAKPVKPPSDPELAAIREKSILPVLRNLQSPDPKSRTTAASAIANIVADTKCRKLLLREQIVHILLTETLTDVSLESKAAGWEILRVLVAEEEPDFCVHLYRVDILTAIQHTSAKIAEAFIPPHLAFSKLPKAEQSFIWCISEALSEIIAALAAAQDEALDAASRAQEILRLLFTLVSFDSTTASVLKSVLSCMITLSEDNRQFVEAILGDSTNQPYNHLTAFKSGGDYKAVLACGVLHNVFSVMDWNDQNPGRDGACDAALVPTLSRVLERTNLNGDITNGHDSASLADISTIALEVLASIGTTLLSSSDKGSRAKKETAEEFDNKGDDAMDADESDDGSDGENPANEDDEMDEDEMEADMEIVTGLDDDADGPSGIDDLPTLKELVHRAIPQIVKLLRAVQGVDDISTQIRVYALSALNNIAWRVSCVDFGEGANAGILQAWTPVAQLLWKEVVAPVLASNTSDVRLATEVTSLAWAVARASHQRLSLVGDEHQKFISLYHASKGLGTKPEDPFQSLGVKCIGVLGQLALDPAPATLNREIGVFLVTVIAALPETSAAEVVEALNQLFDIYGDEKSANDRDVFWKDNFLQHIEATVPKVKAMVKTADRRKSAELRIRAEEVSLNLSRFIQYKQKHRP